MMVLRTQHMSYWDADHKLRWAQVEPPGEGPLTDRWGPKSRDLGTWATWTAGTDSVEARTSEVSPG